MLDDQRQYRKELPKLDKEPPVGYRPGWQIEERLTGLGIVLLGILGMLVAVLMTTGVIPLGPTLPTPPGFTVRPPVLGPMTCVTSLMAIGGVALVVLGLRRAIDP